MVKVNRILAAVFKEVNDYKMIRMDVTETILYRRYGVEIRPQMNKEETENIPDTIELENGKDFKCGYEGKTP